MSTARDTAWAAAETWHGRMIELSHSLHAEPETAFQEHASSAKVAALLESAGFTVESGVCDLPTALVATYGTGDLTVGVCAEYDALPEIGHACGHNVIAAVGCGAAIALASVADDLGIRIRLLGTPAEEEGGGKALMLERGAFDGLAVALMAHPGPSYDVADPRFSSHAVSRFQATFHGRAAHAAAAPTHGVNAADAAVVAQVAIGQLRQQIRGDARISGFVSEGGQRTNIIPERSRLEYDVRTRVSEELGVLKDRVLDCFRGAALATGTTVDFEPAQPDYLELRQDEWLMAAYADAVTALGRTRSHLLQTTLARLYASWHRVAAAENIDAYAQRVLVTTHLGQRCRRWLGERPAAVFPDVVGPDVDLGRVDDQAVLRQALATPTPRQRIAVVLRYYSELSEADVASATLFSFLLSSAWIPA